MKTLYSIILVMLFLLTNQIISQVLNLEFSTFLGGSSEDRAHGMDVDEWGNVFLTAPMHSANFPITDNALSSNPTGIYFSKVNKGGDSLLISTYIGASGGANYAHGVAIDKDGCIYIVGNTTNSNFPTSENAFDRTFNGPSDKSHGDAFVIKLNSEGTEIIYSTFIGGSGMDLAGKITVDSEGNAYIIGNTGSVDLPVTEGAFDTSFNGGGEYGREDIFAAKLNHDGSELIYCTYLGGSEGEIHGSNILVDDSGCAMFALTTASPDFPVTDRGYDTSFNGGDGDAVVIKLSPDGKSLESSTFIGSNGADGASLVLKDGEGNIYVCCSADSNDFPLTSKLIGEEIAQTGYIVKFNPDLSELLFSFQFYSGLNSIAIDKSGNLVLAGVTDSKQFPVTDKAYSKELSGNNDIFITIIDPITEKMLYSTYLGGSKNEVLSNVIIHNEAIYLSGNTNSSDFPTSINAYDKTYNGGTSEWGGDAYIVKFNIDEVSSVKDGVGSLMHEFNLKQNYPNPFNPTTIISYSILDVGGKYFRPVQLNVYDMLGREIKTLVNSNQTFGEYSVQWNGTDNFNNQVCSGTYIYSLLTEEVSYHKKMVLLR